MQRVALLRHPRRASRHCSPVTPLLRRAAGSLHGPPRYYIQLGMLSKGMLSKGCLCIEIELLYLLT
jgi:hypothetical protein